MDEAVKALLLPALLFALLLVLGGAHAQGWQDPTRPAMAAPDSGTGAASAEAAPQLQSVLIGQGGGGGSGVRKVAVISGKTMRVGDRFGDAVLVKISDDRVTLRRDTKLIVLKLSLRHRHRRAALAPPVALTSNNENIQHD
jgi:MSHA biogenesis protein MshK